MKIVMNQQDTVQVAAFEGALDENAAEPLEQLALNLTKKALIIDLDRLTYVNSIGASHWLDFLEQVPVEAKMRFRNCPVGFVGYCNLIDGFVGNGSVSTLYIPCHCKSCERTENRLFKAADFQSGLELPEVACQRCNATMVSEVDLTLYLAFMQTS